MKKVTEKSLQNLWDYCQEAYDDDEITNNFFRHVDQLLGRGDVDFDKVMDFIRANGIKRVKPATRAKTVDLPTSTEEPLAQVNKKVKPFRGPRSKPAYPGDSCESRTGGGCESPRISPTRYHSSAGCGGSNPSC